MEEYYQSIDYRFTKRLRIQIEFEKIYENGEIHAVVRKQLL